MLSIFLICLFLSFITFCLSNFQFLSILIVLENINVLILLSSSYIDSLTNNISFLAFIVVVTIEVVLALVILTRVWSEESLNF
uniref:NADH dehydrogenase subunit 4L n=1 Tax=Neobenedenia melleni TaxID=280695 RepID=A0A096VGU4_9PLAT|nr:NADH dehydrogenase subunit 4L [Neobenedenia melleni]